MQLSRITLYAKLCMGNVAQSWQKDYCHTNYMQLSQFECNQQLIGACKANMKLSLVKLVISLSFVQLSFQYGSYPRRYTRDHSSQEACPSQCRCMNLNQRSVRGLFDSWNVGRSWQSSEPDESGRSVVCQGLRELPSDIPSGK